MVAKDRVVKAKYFEYGLRFDDGVFVVTNNVRGQLSVHKRLPLRFSTPFPDVEDIRELYRLHRFLVDRYRRCGTPICGLLSEFRGDVLKYIARAVLDEPMRQQVEAGYYIMFKTTAATVPPPKEPP